MQLPKSPTTILNFIAAFEDKQREIVKQLGTSWTGNPWGPPILMHCKAGFGRSGLTSSFFGSLATSTILPGALTLIYNAITSFSLTKSVNFPEIVTKLRSQRNHAVERPSQYKFCHETVIEFMSRFKKISKNFTWETY
jgi:protein tyrosine phosphatase